MYANRKFKTKYPDYDPEILEYILHTNSEVCVRCVVSPSLTPSLVGGSAHGHPSSSEYYWDEDIEAVWEKWSSLKNAAYKGFVGAKDAFNKWKAERIQWVEESLQVRLLFEVFRRYLHSLFLTAFQGKCELVQIDVGEEQ